MAKNQGVTGGRNLTQKQGAGHSYKLLAGQLTDSTIALIAPASIAKVDPQEKVGAPHCAK